MYVGNYGTFTMNGEETSVSGNTATNGGGVYVDSGTFNMNDGTIGGATEAAANTATNNGGGVYVSVSGKDSKFEMNDDASVTGNTTTGNQTARKRASAATRRQPTAAACMLSAARSP